MPSPPRVLFLTYNFPPKLGGLEQVVLEVWKALGRRAEVVTLAQHAEDPVPDAPGVQRPGRGGPAAFLGFALARGLRLARPGRFDVVVAGSALVALPAWLAARRAGARAVLLTYGLDTIHPARAYQALYRAVVPRFDRVVAISGATRDAVVARGVAAERIRIVPPGCHGRRFAEARDVGELRARWGLAGARVILSAGRLVRRKGLDRFVRECLPRVVEHVPEAVLLLAGGNPEGALAHREDMGARVRAAAREVGLADRVVVTGRLDADALAGAFQLADVFVLPVVPLPGDMEGFGIVLLEAAAAGLPAVATRLGGIPDALADGDTGVLVPPLDYAGMAQAIVGFLEDEGLRRATAERARRRVLDGFLWEQVAPRWAAAILDS